MFEILKLTSTELAVVADNNGMKMYLSGLLKEVSTTPRSWLYDGKEGNAFLEPDDVLHKWMQYLQTLEHGSHFEQEVFQFDTSQLEKWGPQGGHPPVMSTLQDTILPSFEDQAPSPAFSTKNWAIAKNSTVKLLKTVFKTSDLRPVSYENVLNDMRARDTLESNSGWPDFTRRNKPEIKSRAVAAASTGEWEEYPAILLFRYYNGKLRMVWMYPLSTNLVEGSYFQALQSTMIKAAQSLDGGMNFFAPWIGFESVREFVSRAYARGYWIAASDFSSTDQHFRLEASMEVCDVLEQLFQVEYRKGLRYSIEKMHNIPLIISPDLKIVGEHGVSSGSNWTNFIETVFDLILSKYVELETRGRIQGMYAIGDDMTWLTEGEFPDFKQVLEQIGASVGQQIKAEKTTYERDSVKSLQRYFQRGYLNVKETGVRGVYSTIRALKSSVYPERFHDPKRTGWDSDMFCARQFMILENCLDHPLFKEFVSFVCKGNKHLVPFARQAAGKLDQITRESKLIPGLNPSYNQEKRDKSLAKFESIVYAATL